MRKLLLLSVLFSFYTMNGEEKNDILPFFEEGKVWECIGVNQSLPPQYGHSYSKTTYTVKGDTIIEDASHKKLHIKTIYENGDIEEYVSPVDGNTPNAYRYDFTLKKGDFLLIYESGYTRMGFQVTNVKDTLLNDGVKRRCLMLEYIVCKIEEEKTVETFTMGNDIWVEGIGSLISGLEMNDPYKPGGTTYTLQSVKIGDQCIYQNVEEQKPNTPVINNAYITPEFPSADDEVIFNVELGEFPGNVSYSQKVDSIVSHTIYVSGSFYGYSTITMLPVTYDLSLGRLEEGKYTLRHTIKAMPTDIENIYTYNFKVKGANQIESINKGIQLQIEKSTLLSTSPHATKLEVYTLDAVKVSEASFHNGEASVKVNKTPSTYLYIVTYPDGHRESGKVMVN